MTAVALEGSVVRKIWDHPLGKLSMGVIVFIAIVAILGYLITPDPTPYANSMNLPLATKPPGTEADLLKIPLDVDHEETGWLTGWLTGSPSSYRTRVLTHWKAEGDHFFVQDAEGKVVESIPLEKWGTNISSDDFQGQFVEHRTYWLGTDKYGRDLLSRLIIGARISFSVGFIAVVISLLLGIPLGAYAGYFGGRVDSLIMWLVNVVWSIPTLLMVIALTLALGKGFWQVFIAVGLTMWVEVARVIRGQVISEKNKEYVEAGQVLGFTRSRIIWKHILPNVMAPLIVISAANFASAILIESGLSFLGIGAQPPMPSWGGMVKDHYPYLVMGKAYLAVIPGACILILVLAFMTLGNVLRDVLDVRRAG
ncbi:MAG: ABC transporter permease [Bacteroidota bacterium]|nr:ABC transporter permease [Bacteroidota bacterium]MDX5505638.1 ABC transporter permease [Bacteroidota bacterium]